MPVVTRASVSLAIVGDNYCRLCKTVMAPGEGALGQGPFGRLVLCCPDCLSGYAPSSYAVVQPRLGRRKTVATTEYHKPVDPAALPIGVKPRHPQNTARFFGPRKDTRYRPDPRFLVRKSA